jgi:hypothetical protein
LKVFSIAIGVIPCVGSRPLSIGVVSIECGNKGEAGRDCLARWRKPEFIHSSWKNSKKIWFVKVLLRLGAA